MQVLICCIRHVVVDDDVYSFEVDSSSEDVCRDENSRLVLLEFVVPVEALLLVQTAVDRHRREVALAQQLVELLCSSHAVDENNNLIEVQHVQQIVQLAVLLLLAQFHVVLLQAVQSELRLVVDVDFNRLLMG